MSSAAPCRMLPALRGRILAVNGCTFRSISTSTSASASASINSASWTRRFEIWWKSLPLKNKRIGISVTTIGVMAIGFRRTQQSRTNDHEDPRDLTALSTVPLSKLCSGWIAFAFCSSPTWIDISEPMYNVISRIPIVCSIANAFVIRTFFNQFLGGQTTEECIPKIETLRKDQVGTLLGYNIEANLDGSSKDPELIARQIQHVLSSIDAQGMMAKKFCPDASTTGGDSRCWVRIKLTGLLPHPIALQRGSDAILRAREEKGLDKDVPYPGLPHDGDWAAALNGKEVTVADREQLLSLRATLETIASKARDNKVRVVIDAEQSWYQPVIDSLTDELMQKYNTFDGPATCIASFQAYLRRYPQLLDQQIHRADEKGYKLLFKQVRGAYIVSEADKWAKRGRGGSGPVWSTKKETDASYNYGIEKTLATVARQIQETGHSRISGMFATHNSASADLAIRLLEKHGLAERSGPENKLMVPREVAGSIAFGQIYGMKDDLTNKITGAVEAEDNLPLVVKSMSYGDLKECLPFLARRATENKAILEGRGGAVAERVRLGREIWRRVVPRWSGS